MLPFAENGKAKNVQLFACRPPLCGTLLQFLFRKIFLAVCLNAQLLCL